MPLSAVLVHGTRDCCYSYEAVSKKLGIQKIDHVPQCVSRIQSTDPFSLHVYRRNLAGSVVPGSAHEDELKQQHQHCETCSESFGVFTKKRICQFCSRCLCSKCLTGGFDNGSVLVVTHLELVVGKVVTSFRNKNNQSEVADSCSQCELKEAQAQQPPDGKTLVVFIGMCSMSDFTPRVECAWRQADALGARCLRCRGKHRI